MWGRCVCVLRHCGLEQREAADADDAAPSDEQPCCLGNWGVMEQSCCALIGWKGWLRWIRAPWQAEWPLVRREPAEGGREEGKGH
ncbi:hypothetical protein HF521_021531 [Silurus meridionalis]|uniref:Uncharacterized protein n=1 Tax=Silurus meridionalis TaxID=175797 RepID=A0A8T0BC06_SILME|nr:hypothetical protein HF521_021531 [Silurus meridionalis]